MRKVSIKQAKKNREIAKIKKTLSPFCILCPNPGSDVAHLLPKSIWPEYYTLPANLVLTCRSCHNKYDNDIQFRKKQTSLIEQVKSFDEMAATKYFDL